MEGFMVALRLGLVIVIALGCSPRGDAQSPHQTGPPPELTQALRTRQGPVEAEMRHVLYHVDDRVVLQIEYLRGALIPTRDEPPWFDDPESFALAIDTGEVTLSVVSLSALLNDYVFN